MKSRDELSGTCRFPLPWSETMADTMTDTEMKVTSTWLYQAGLSDRKIGVERRRFHSNNELRRLQFPSLTFGGMHIWNDKKCAESG